MFRTSTISSFRRRIPTANATTLKNVLRSIKPIPHRYNSTATGQSSSTTTETTTTTAEKPKQQYVEDEVSKKLVEWAKEKNILFPKLAPALFNEDYVEEDGEEWEELTNRTLRRGFIATEEIKAGEVIMWAEQDYTLNYTIHRDLINATFAEAGIKETISKCFKNHLQENIPRLRRLLRNALFICFEKQKGDKSKWSTIFEAWPEGKDLSVPFNWTEDEAKYFEGTDLFEERKTELIEFEKQYEILYNQVFKLHPSAFDDKYFSIDAVKSNLMLAKSRLIGYSTSKIYPFFDFFNHKRGHASLEVNPTNNSVQLRAAKDYKPGEQVYMSYLSDNDPSISGYLLGWYGFLDPNDPNDFAGLEVEPDEYGNNMMPLPRYEINPELINMYFAKLKTPKRASDIFKTENYLEAIRMVRKRVEKLAKSIPSTMEQDYELLKSPELSHNAKLAVLYRITQRDIIFSHDEKLQEEAKEVKQAIKRMRFEEKQKKPVWD